MDDKKKTDKKLICFCIVGGIFVIGLTIFNIFGAYDFLQSLVTIFKNYI